MVEMRCVVTREFGIVGVLAIDPVAMPAGVRGCVVEETRRRRQFAPFREMDAVVVAAAVYGASAGLRHSAVAYDDPRRADAAGRVRKEIQSVAASAFERQPVDYEVALLARVGDYSHPVHARRGLDRMRRRTARVGEPDVELCRGRV